MVQQMTNSVLTNVKMIRNEKSYYHLLSFFVFCVAKIVVFYHFSGPIPSPDAKFAPRNLILKTWLSMLYKIHLSHSAWASEQSYLHITRMSEKVPSCISHLHLPSFIQHLGYSSFSPSMFSEIWRLIAAHTRADKASQRTARSLITSVFIWRFYFY